MSESPATSPPIADDWSIYCEDSTIHFTRGGSAEMQQLRFTSEEDAVTTMYDLWWVIGRHPLDVLDAIVAKGLRGPSPEETTE